MLQQKTLFGWYRLFPYQNEAQSSSSLIFLSPSVIHFLVPIFNTEADFLRSICFSGAQKWHMTLLVFHYFLYRIFYSKIVSKLVLTKLICKYQYLPLRQSFQFGGKSCLGSEKTKWNIFFFACSFGSLKVPLS